MFDNTKLTTDRGQVGIGTLIVFIAMVLVAAIAAGVLINTAGLLQSQAEATGEESAEQVSDRVVVSTVTGVVGDNGDEVNDALVDGEVDRLKLTVARSPGAGDIDLTNAIVEVFANGQSGTLTFDDRASDDDFELETEFDVNPGDDSTDDLDFSTFGDEPAAGDSDGEFALIDGFAVVNIQGEANGVLSDSSDRAQLVLDLSNVDGDAPLEEGDSVSLTVTTASGGTAFVEKRTPSSFDPAETVRL